MNIIKIIVYISLPTLFLFIFLKNLMTSKVYRPEMSLYRDGQFWPSGKIPMVGAGSFNQHLSPCFTNSALPPPISKLSTPAAAGSLLEQGQTRPQRCGKLGKYFVFFCPTPDWRPEEEMGPDWRLKCVLFPPDLTGRPRIVPSFSALVGQK